MAKKYEYSNSDIEKDIINAIKNPQNMPEESYRKSNIFGKILAVILVLISIVISFMYPFFIFWLTLALVVFLLGYLIFNYIRLKIRIKNVTINDYDITTEVVYCNTEEHYKIRRGRKYHSHYEKIDNYIIRFESGKIWRIPKEKNYSWNDRLRMTDLEVYKIIHIGDSVTTVTKKSTGEIVMAYSNELFEYKA